MSHIVIRDILDDIKNSPFLSVMVDEATDKSNLEQLTLVIRWVSDDLSVSEEFLGMYSRSATDAKSIVSVLLDALLRFQNPLSKVRGQCYDRYSTMAGVKYGVATQIAEKEPRAVFTHCFGHALNLGVSDTVKQSQLIKYCLDTCFELVKLVKFSPKREAMLRNIKEEIGSEALGIRTLCPTRWTVRADSLGSIIANYDNLLLLWESSLLGTSNTEMKARIYGIRSQMQTFRFLFGIFLSQMILQHTDRLSSTLQQSELSSVEGHEVAMLDCSNTSRDVH